ncbi:M20/M25/M40 family metallo-hydrolase [bacterium]|nr:M20/M25/M40 family metallo-hydrolase [bacterium]
MSSEQLLTWLRGRQAPILETLRQLVEQNSGTDNTKGVTAVQRLISEFCETLGMQSRMVRSPTGANLGLIISTPAATRVITNGGKVPLILGHADTVYGPDDPFQYMRIDPDDSDRVIGPGVADMKGGIVAALYALNALHQMGRLAGMPLIFAVHSAEEKPSPESDQFFAELAKLCAFGLVIEPSLDGQYQIVTARKGMLVGRCVVTGKEAHAGNDHASGANAIAQMAQVIPVIHSLTNYDSGITANVGRVSGGTQLNVVPCSAEFQFEIRVETAAALDSIAKRIRAMNCAPSSESLQVGLPYVRIPGCGVTIEITQRVEPLEETDPSHALAKQYAEAAEQFGISRSVVPMVGGLSDANQLAKYGVPAIDRLGPIGGKMHVSKGEWLDVTTLVPTAANLAWFLLNMQSH